MVRLTGGLKIRLAAVATCGGRARKRAKREEKANRNPCLQFQPTAQFEHSYSTSS